MDLCYRLKKVKLVGFKCVWLSLISSINYESVVYINEVTYRLNIFRFCGEMSDLPLY